MMNIFSKITRLRVIMAVCAVAAIVFAVMAVQETFARSKPRDDLYNLTDFTFKNGEYVTGEIDFVWGNYAETINESKTFGITTSSSGYSQHYLIDCVDKDGNNRLISAEVTDPHYIELFNELDALSWSDDPDDLYSKTITFTGRVTKLDSELATFAFDYMNDWDIFGNRAEFDEYFLPYSVRIVTNNAYSPVMMGVFAAIFLVVAAVIFFIDRFRARRG